LGANGNRAVPAGTARSSCGSGDPVSLHFALFVTKGRLFLAVTGEERLFLFGAEVPIEDQSLTFRVAGHPLPVPPELRIVRREQLQAGERPLAELVDDRPVAEDALHLPVGGQGTEVDDPHVPLRRLGLLQLFR
jgi:hypothetical protein